MRLTTFGGETDLYDRAYNQAYLPEPDRTKETPAKYYARVPAWVQSLLRPEMAQADSWPRLEQWYYRAGDVKNKVKRLARVGLSYWLDDVLYAAWDIDENDAEGIRMARRGWLYVEFTTPNGIIIARVTDHGNSGASGRPVMDVSPAVYRAIKDYWPKNVSYRLVVLPE